MTTIPHPTLSGTPQMVIPTVYIPIYILVPTSPVLPPMTITATPHDGSNQTNNSGSNSEHEENESFRKFLVTFIDLIFSTSLYILLSMYLNNSARGRQIKNRRKRTKRS
jgi:hypothetical protein